MKRIASFAITLALFAASAARADSTLIFTVTNDYLKDRADLFIMNTEKKDTVMSTLTHRVMDGEKVEKENVFTLDDVQSDKGVLLMRMGGGGALGRDVVRLKAAPDFSLTDGGDGQLWILRRYGVLFRDDDVRVLNLRIDYSKENGWGVYYLPADAEKPVLVTSMHMLKNVMSGDTVGIKKVTLNAGEERVDEVLTQKLPGLKRARGFSLWSARLDGPKSSR